MGKCKLNRKFIGYYLYDVNKLINNKTQCKCYTAIYNKNTEGIYDTGKFINLK